MRLLFILISISIYSIGLNSQTYSGKVQSACGGEPLEGVEVNFWGQQGSLNYNSTTETDENGVYSLTVNPTGTDNFWIIGISNPAGNSIPTSKLFYPSQGNQSNVNFTFLEQPIMELIDENGNGIPLDPEVNPTDALFFWQMPTYCTNSDNHCISLPSDYISSILQQGESDICFSATVYSYNSSLSKSKRLGKLDCFRINPSCPSPISVDEVCSPYSFDIDSILRSSQGRIAEIRITQSCCDRSQCPDENSDPTNYWSVWFRVDGISQASVSFNFNVNETVDINNPGDSPGDGVEPATTTPSGPALGRTSTGINATIDSEEVLDEMTYKFYEVDCNFGTDEDLFYSQTLPLDNEGQPENFSFSNLEDDNGDPYFLDDANHVGKCFKVECIASNNCGEVQAYSYFTIDPNEWFDQGDDELFGRSNTNQNAFTSNFIQLYPNPAQDLLQIDYIGNCENNKAQIIDLNGKVLIDKIPIGDKTSIDISELSKGLYYAKVNGNDLQTIRFIKL